MSSPLQTATRVGIFDSGVGGLSVLRALRSTLPDQHFHYIADSGHAPYGDRDGEHVIERSLKLTDHLVAQGAGLVVVACNTATAWAIEALRARHPGLPLVGIEPGVKPAAALSRNRRIGVLATPATLASQRFDRLVERHAQACEVVRVPCPGLAAAIERGEAGRHAADVLLDRYCSALRQADVDTVVLGCTHYPFVAERIAARLAPGVTLMDTAEAVARQALALHQRAGWQTFAKHSPAPDVLLQTTGDRHTLEHLALDGLGLHQPAEFVAV
jgi:glutamate racemase